MNKKKYLFKNEADYLLMGTTPMNLEKVKEFFKRMLYLNELNDVYFVKDEESEYFHVQRKEDKKELNFVVAPHSQHKYGIYGRKQSAAGI